MDPLRPTTTEDRTEVWQIVLDRLELDVIGVERALTEGTGLPRRLEEWYQPDDYGPVPEALRARAGEVLERQRTALAQLAQHLGVIAHHRELVEDVERLGRGHGAGPVYLDVSF